MRSHLPLTCYLVENNAGDRLVREQLGKLYTEWKKNWHSLFHVMGATQYCNSDEFNRQQQFLIVNYENTIIASVGIRRLYLDTDFGCEDTYLKPWPINRLKMFSSSDASILLLSGFNISPDFCKNRINGLPVIYIFGSLIIKYFLSQTIESMITLARVGTGVGKLCAKFGAQKLGAIDNFHDVKQHELMCFQKSSINKYPIPECLRIEKNLMIVKNDYLSEINKGAYL